MLTDRHKLILKLLNNNPELQQQEIADKIELSLLETKELMTQLETQGLLEYTSSAFLKEQDNLVICIGAANVDYKLISRESIVLHTSNPVSSTVSTGGVIRNIAENCGRLGMNVSLLSVVGDDHNADLIFSEAENIFDTHKIDRHPSLSTGSYTAVLDSNRELVVGLANMEISKYMNREWIKSHKDTIALAKTVVIDMNVEKDALDETIKITQTFNIPLVIVGVSAPKMERLPSDFKNVTLGIFNLDESQAYFKSKESSQTLAQKWITAGLSEVIITASTDDTIYANEGNLLSFKVKKAKHVVDVTGAGDSFVAGVVYGLSNNLSTEESIPYGLANSYLTIQQPTSVNLQLTEQLLIDERKKINE
ncbi:MAG TPA: winged helix-turn-helix transcriptional regulator [Erysipelothrix sp.]|jgi:sugar/nucleoside kinase (ribokinase family)|nr:winged helix-turn-helix transcriptional regulator [Erysipelothrix sp.]